MTWVGLGGKKGGGLGETLQKTAALGVGGGKKDFKKKKTSGGGNPPPQPGGGGFNHKGGKGVPRQNLSHRLGSGQGRTLGKIKTSHEKKPQTQKKWGETGSLKGQGPAPPPPRQQPQRVGGKNGVQTGVGSAPKKGGGYVPALKRPKKVGGGSPSRSPGFPGTPPPRLWKKKGFPPTQTKKVGTATRGGFFLVFFPKTRNRAYRKKKRNGKL